MRISAIVATLATAASGCVTATALSIVPRDTSRDDLGAIVVGGALIDGIGLTAFGAGALDGQSSLGWSRGEGEWAIAGGVALLVIDALVITLLATEDDDATAPVPPAEPMPPRARVTVHATALPGYEGIALIIDLAQPLPHIGERLADVRGEDIGFEHSRDVDFGEHRACAIYARGGAIARVSCTTVRIDDAHREITIPAPITSPR